MMSAPRESAVPGLPDRATGAPLRMSVIESPGVAPVTHASSTEPFPWSLPSPDAPAVGDPAVRAVPAKRAADASASPHLASTRQVHTVPPLRMTADPQRFRSALSERSWHRTIP